MQADRFFRVNDSCNPFDRPRRHFIGGKTGVVLIAFLLLFSGGLVYGTVHISYNSDFPCSPTGTNQGFISTTNGEKLFNATNTGLQQAVWHLNDTGGTVWLPTGNITISSTIGINYDSISIVGSGSKLYGAEGPVPHEEGTVLWVETDLPEGVFKTRTDGLGAWQFADNFRLKDITIKGDGEHTVIGVNLTGTSMSIIENVFFKDLNESAIYGNNAHAPTIRNCWFDSCGNNYTDKAVIYFTSDTTYVTDPVIDACVFSGGYYAWIDVDYSPDSGHLTGSRNGKVQNCYFEGGSTTIKYGVMPGEHWIIANNNFRGGVISHYVFITSGKPQKVQISDNYFAGESGAENYAIYLSSSVTGCSISDNILGEVYKGIGATTGCNNITIANNYIYGRTDISADYAGIYVSGTSPKNIFITGNHITNFDTDLDFFGTGIHINTGNNIVISNNYVADCEMGIRLAGNNNTLCNNILHGITKADYEIHDTSTDPVIFGNYGTQGGAEAATNAFIFPTNNNTYYQKGFAGYAWFNTSTNVLNVYNGTAWISTTFT